MPKPYHSRSAELWWEKLNIDSKENMLLTWVVTIHQVTMRLIVWPYKSLVLASVLIASIRICSWKSFSMTLLMLLTPKRTDINVCFLMFLEDRKGLFEASFRASCHLFKNETIKNLSLGWNKNAKKPMLTSSKFCFGFLTTVNLMPTQGKMMIVCSYCICLLFILFSQCVFLFKTTTNI